LLIFNLFHCLFKIISSACLGVIAELDAKCSMQCWSYVDRLCFRIENIALSSLLPSLLFMHIFVRLLRWELGALVLSSSHVTCEELWIFLFAMNVLPFNCDLYICETCWVWCVCSFLLAFMIYNRSLTLFWGWDWWVWWVGQTIPMFFSAFFGCFVCWDDSSSISLSLLCVLG
jgi:hypothetical protein